MFVLFFVGFFLVVFFWGGCLGVLVFVVVLFCFLYIILLRVWGLVFWFSKQPRLQKYSN